MNATGTKKAFVEDPALTASQLRADVYNVLDRVIATGQPVSIERKGVMLKIVLEKPMSKMERIAANAQPGIWLGPEKTPAEVEPIDWTIDWRKKWGIDDDEWAKAR